VVRLLELDPRPWPKLGATDEIASVHFPLRSPQELRELPAEAQDFAGEIRALGFAVNVNHHIKLSAGAFADVVLTIVASSGALVTLNAGLKAAAQIPENWRKLTELLKRKKQASLSPELQLEEIYRWLDTTYSSGWHIDLDNIHVKQIADACVFEFQETTQRARHRILLLKGELIVLPPAERKHEERTEADFANSAPDRRKKNPDAREGTEFAANIVFVVIKDLKACTDAPKVPNALRALNEALRGIDSDAFVLSTLAGVIVVVPDAVSGSADDTLHALDQAKIGFALRVGVTHGIVEVVRDIDDEPNLIGPEINIAARLATSNDNPGMLVHESYTRLIDSVLPATHWLHRSVRTAISIAGKPQDPVFTCFAGPQRFEAKQLENEEPSPSRPAVLIAYDLPKFSAGDRAQLRKRFTRLAHVFQKLRQSSPMQAGTALLSPGGDGGVLVLEGVNLPDAAAIAARLQVLAEIESRDHHEDIAVALRIGVHYGPVMHYTNARGISRPTGLAVFIADEIAGDEHARSRHGVILTHLLAECVAGGSHQQLESEFEKIRALTSGPANGLDRFVKTDAGPKRAGSGPRTPLSQPTMETPRTQPDLLKRLSTLLPSQFEEVLFRASVPTAHLPSESSPQAARAIAAIRHLDQQNRLDELTRILDEVMAVPR
jgi:class 3 adenylate cyclase